MLSPEKTAEVRYSFTLFERGADGFRVRVQTDSTNQPFDINEGSKLELGSTAKLRVLTTYLEIVAELHQRYAGLGARQLDALEAEDNLTRWALAWLAANEDRSLPAMLEAALDRRYSASPAERFFTGSGLHRFGNFRREDDGRLPSMRESLQESINLPFVRLMRDLVSYSMHQTTNSAELLKDDENPERLEYLARFADREGAVFLQRFWKKYRGKTSEERIQAFLDGMRPTPTRLAAVHRYLMPDADRASFERFLRSRLEGETLTEKQLDGLYTRYGPGRFSLPDQGYVARVHPLDLWLLGYLIQRPDAASPRSTPPAATNARRSTAGCCAAATRARATAASASCWRSRPSPTSTAAGSAWAIRSTTWCRRWPPRWAARGTGRRRWPN